MKKTKVSIVIPTLGRETLYPLIRNLLKQKVNFQYEIVLVPQVKLKENLLKNKKIKIHYEPLGNGFAYYRNVGIKLGKGEIIVFIDDDEIPMNLNWLSNITKLIIAGGQKVVTAGTMIELGQGYFTDSVSLLGFPGGGAVGFRIMWNVNKDYSTEHLCSGNLAIRKSILKKVGKFTHEMKNGNEDVNLADKLIKSKIKIHYSEDSTVYHIARKGYFNFVKWNYLRGKSNGDYLSSNKSGGKITNRLKSSLRILRNVSLGNTIYLPGVIFAMGNQYIFQTLGVIWRKFNGK